jgi:hypothetical protein
MPEKTTDRSHGGLLVVLRVVSVPHFFFKFVQVLFAEIGEVFVDHFHKEPEILVVPICRVRVEA